MSEKKIRVLYILDNLAIGGAQQIVLTLAKYLDKKQFHVAVCTLFSRDSTLEEPLADEIKKAGIPVYPLAMVSWRDWNTIKSLLRIIDNEGVDIVHSHMVPAEFWGSFLSKLLRRKRTLYTRHNTYTPKGFASKLQLFLLNHLISEKVVAISDSTFQNLVTQCRTNPGKIVTIPNGVETEKFSPALTGERLRESWGISGDVPVIGNLSRFEQRKGYDVFLNVAFELKKRNIDALFLAMGYGPEEEHLRSRATQLDLGRHVLFVKPRRDMPEVMSALDILLFTPYWGEGLPTIVLEAMASGKPVVASNTGSNREIVIDGITGFLPSPKTWVMETNQLDAAAFAEKILYLIRNKDHARQMGIEGRRVVEQNFSVEKMVQKTEALYRNLVMGTL